MTDTTAQHIAARDDADLSQRLSAAAEQAGVEQTSVIIWEKLGQLISAPIVVNGEETTITKVHAYAAAVREELLKDDRLLPPGQNPGAVTDDHLRAALVAVGIVPPAS